jgi:hypothetical protein
MILALAIIVFVLAVLTFVLFGALIELFEQVKQLRRFLDLEDRVTPIDIGDKVGELPSEFGLPQDLDTAGYGLVLTLSTKCATCQTLAATLRGGALPPDTWLVVVPVIGDGREFIDAYELYGERVLVDEGQQLTRKLGIEVSPSVLFISEGRLAGAQTVPSVRQLRAILPKNNKASSRALTVTATSAGDAAPAREQ